MMTQIVVVLTILWRMLFKRGGTGMLNFIEVGFAAEWGGKWREKRDVGDLDDELWFFPNS
jgi:hypothetical protein